MITSLIRMLKKLNTTASSDRNAKEKQAAAIVSQIQTQKGEVNALNLVYQLYRHFNVLIPYKYRQNGQTSQRNCDVVPVPVSSKPEAAYRPTKPNRRRPKSPMMIKHGRGLITVTLPILEKKAQEVSD